MAGTTEPKSVNDDTCLTNVLSRSWGSTPYLNTANSTPTQAVLEKQKEAKVNAIPPQTDDCGALNAIFSDGNPFKVHWKDANSTEKTVFIPKSVTERLRASFTLSSDCFQDYVHSYIRSKFENLKSQRYPFVISPDLYVLCREVFGVSHELFADTLNVSGVLRSFCSLDSRDIVFGSSGTWEEVEETIAGGAGNPPFEAKFVEKVVKIMEKNVDREQAYCRVLILPFHEEGPLCKLKNANPYFLGESLVVVKPDMFRVRHQGDIFKDTEDERPDWCPNVPVALVIWINEAYRILNPPPLDVEEVFAHWAIHNFGNTNVLDLDAIYRAFPDRNRNGAQKSDMFAIYTSSWLRSEGEVSSLSTH